MPTFFEKVGREVKRVICQLEVVLGDGKELLEKSSGNFRSVLLEVIRGYDNYPPGRAEEDPLHNVIVGEIEPKEEESGVATEVQSPAAEPPTIQHQDAAEAPLHNVIVGEIEPKEEESGVAPEGQSPAAKPPTIQHQDAAEGRDLEWIKHSFAANTPEWSQSAIISPDPQKVLRLSIATPSSQHTSFASEHEILR